MGEGGGWHVQDGDPVEIVDYDPRWPDSFASEAARVLLALSGHVIGVEHIGSTAVEGLVAKPVIDMQVGARSLDSTDEIVAALTAIGYAYVPELEQVFPARRYFFKMEGSRRTHQVHLVERSNSEWWDRHIAFREWLRAHPEDRGAYGAMKRRLATTHRHDRDGYTNAKSEFVGATVAKARDGSRGTRTHRRGSADAPAG